MGQWHVLLTVPRRYSHLSLNKCLFVSVCLLCFCSLLHSCCFLVLVLCISGGCLLCMLCFLHELFPLIYIKCVKTLSHKDQILLMLKTVAVVKRSERKSYKSYENQVDITWNFYYDVYILESVWYLKSSITATMICTHKQTFGCWYSTGPY